MGCCYSLPSMVDRQRKKRRGGDPPLKMFSYPNLESATQNFGWGNIVSNSGEEASDIVYKGRLQNLGLVAVKKFDYMDWADPNQFLNETRRLGKLRHKSVVKLIGYCCDEDERLLVAEFLPNGTLGRRLFHEKNQDMEWDMRFRVAYSIAEALDYCNTLGFASYNNLSAYKVLFNEDGDACLSCFGWMKETGDDERTTRSVNTESVIFRFGIILLELLTGEKIPPSHALDMIHGKTVIELIDTNLKGKFSVEEAIVSFKLASQCLQNEDTKSLNTKDLVTTLETLKIKTN